MDLKINKAHDPIWSNNKQLLIQLKKIFQKTRVSRKIKKTNVDALCSEIKSTTQQTYENQQQTKQGRQKMRHLEYINNFEKVE